MIGFGDTLYIAAIVVLLAVLVLWYRPAAAQPTRRDSATEDPAP